MDEITRHPLHWPHWKRRTPAGEKKHGRFGKKNDRGWKSSLTVHQAIRRIDEEIRAYTRYGHGWRIDPDDVVISTNLRTRLDGGIRAGQPKPSDPGVAVYFELEGVHKCIAIDTHFDVEDNLAAVAATLNALRALERHGSGLVEAAFTGFDALPAPGQVQALNWRDVLDYHGHSLQEVKKIWRQLAGEHHPDRGGDQTTLVTINKAWEQAKAEL